MNEQRKSVALAYTPSLEAPVIVASGRNRLSDRMLEIAQECGITIVNDPVLADILSGEEVGACIPADTYEAVAAIFAFLEKGVSEKWL